MEKEYEIYFSMHKENEGYVDSYILGNGISICFNQIYRSSWRNCSVQKRGFICIG